MRRVLGDSFGQLIHDYLSSPEFKSISTGSQELRRHLLNLAAVVLGDLPVHEVRPKIIRNYINQFSNHPGKQRNTLTAIRAVETWAAIEADLSHYMTKGIKFAKLQGEGHTPWTIEQVLHAEKYCRQDLARAIVLGSLTGQRGSDLVTMCWNDIVTTNDGHRWIQVRQKKTGVELGCFILPELEERLAAWPKQPGPILRDLEGKPFTRHSLSMYWVRELRKNADLTPLKGLHLHGLRGHYCVRLYQGGMTTRDVSQTVGMSLQMVERYCRLSDQKKNVSAAILRFSEYKPLKTLDDSISRK